MKGAGEVVQVQRMCVISEAPGPWIWVAEAGDGGVAQRTDGTALEQAVGGG